MDPVSTIGTALASITTAADIAKLLIDGSLSLKNAEWKLRLADMAEALASTRQQILDIRDLVTERDKTISQLQEALSLKGKLILKDSAYWLPDEKGNAVGGPFCSRCFEIDHVACTLVADEKEPQVKCPNCKSTFCSKPVYYHLRPDAEEAHKKYNVMLSHLGTQRRHPMSF